MSKVLVLLLVGLWSIQVFAFVSTTDSLSNSIPQELVHDAAIYQRGDRKQSKHFYWFKYVQWMYIGFAPRMEEPERVKVVFSKASYSMRVTAQFTKAEIADYPLYLVRKANDMRTVVDAEGIEVPQFWRWSQFLGEIDRVEQEYLARFGEDHSYSEEKYKFGLELLTSKFPGGETTASNIFELPSADTMASDAVGVIAHFVYPITIHVEGKDFPPNRADFTQDEVFRSNFQNQNDSKKNEILQVRVQERRTDHGKRVDGRRVVTDNIFAGFPAFWIYPSEKGVGVHGPIRYSESHERGRPSKMCSNYPRKMQEFWSELDKYLPYNREGQNLQKGLSSVQFRWDLVRTNNSEGCFRAEPMELRHILPAAKAAIYTGVRWTITDQLDKIVDPVTGAKKYVDVNYYTTNPYSCPLSREKWVADRVLPFNRGEGDPKTAAEFIENSVQFEYNDPAVIEFVLPRLTDHPRVMASFNKTGSHFFEFNGPLESAPMPTPRPGNFQWGDADPSHDGFNRGREI